MVAASRARISRARGPGTLSFLIVMALTDLRLSVSGSARSAGGQYPGADEAPVITEGTQYNGTVPPVHVAHRVLAHGGSDRVEEDIAQHGHAAAANDDRGVQRV